MKFSAEDLYEIASEMYRKAGFDLDEVREGIAQWASYSSEEDYEDMEEVKEELETLIENDLAAREEKMKKYTVTFCSYTFHYDNDESRELECEFPETATLEDLTEDARSICEMAARNDDYFKTMTMKEDPFVSVNEEDGYIDVTFDFTEGDFTTDIRVSYTVESAR